MRHLDQRLHPTPNQEQPGAQNLTPDPEQRDAQNLTPDPERHDAQNLTPDPERRDAQKRPTAVPRDVGMSLLPGKIKDWHLQRQAIVYIRQSTPQQVLEHRESAD